MFKSIIFASALSFITANALAANKSVRVINESSHTIYVVQATNSGEDSWGDNLIGDTIAPGESEVIDMDDGARGCVYDMRVLMRNGFHAERMHVNVCSLEDWTIY